MNSKVLKLRGLLHESGWIEPAYVTLDGEGAVASISSQAPSRAELVETIDAYAVPGFCNAHSHAFQYAMAGLAEHLPHGAAADDFWSWREAMYALAGKITPEQMEAVATMLYSEMLRNGITSVAEFHYLHHDQSGKPYAQLAEMGARLAAAAERAGIQLTLLPVFYQKGGFGKDPTPGQRRFLSRTGDEYQRLVEASRAALSGKRDVKVGIAVHSLRAVDTEEIKRLFAAKFAGPAHVHIAEQQKEVDDCLAHLGKRPVAWLLDNAALDARFHLVHATHMTSDETTRLAKTGAVAVICPATEGNLGDGFFPLRTYTEHGGRYAIGSDSHISLNPLEDLRWLDYGMRLRLQRRNVLCLEAGQDSAHQAYDASLRGGRLSLGLDAAGYFPVGSSFDACLIDPEHPVIVCKPKERRLAAFVYAGDASTICGVMRRGRFVVKNQRHERQDEIRRNFAGAMQKLLVL